MYYTVEVHNRIVKIISMFYGIGLWHDQNRSKFRRWLLSGWHLAVYGHYPFSLAAGAMICQNDTETIFLGVMSIVAALAAVRMFYFVLTKDEILKFIRKIGVHRITDSQEEFHRVNRKVNVFIRFVTYFEVMTLVAVTSLIIISLPIFSSEKRLPLNIFIPLDWRSNELYYWICYTFVSYEMWMTVVCSLFNVIIWYLMMAIVLEYQILGNEFERMGWINEETAGMLCEKFSVDRKSDLFLKDLILLIKKHRNLQEETIRFKLMLSNLFLIQLATSGLGICGSVFALAFSSVTNPVQYEVYAMTLLYCLFDIFMVTFFGNEIKLNSENLSLKLFSCNWMDQSQASKKCIFILMEALKRPQQLVIGIFPLDLETFTRILNLAYRMFNVIRA